MNEIEWFKGQGADGMLAAVEGRFTPRRWRLLGAAFLRRRWDLLPSGILREAVEFLETNADAPTASFAPKWIETIDLAIPALGERAAAEAEELVRAAAMEAVEDPNPNAPALPLFVAAGRYAANAVALAARPVELAAAAVRSLFDEPGRAAALRTANGIEDALVARAAGARATSTAIRLKQQGDELADAAASAKNKRLELAKAEEIVRRTQEQEDNRLLDDDAAERAVRKALARFLHELAGNPFGDYRFDEKWRTETVVGLARGIEADRAFDRMPILADALLDADCDSEAVLRHLRGTEKHATEKATHVRGCWVLDRILRPDDPLFATQAPAAKPKRKKKA